MKEANKNLGSGKMNSIINDKFPQKISEIVPSVIYIFELATLKNVYINKEVGLALGYTQREIKKLGYNFVIEKMHPHDQPPFLQHIEKLKKITREEVLTFEYRLKSAKGSWRWYQSRDTAYEFNTDGSPSHIIGTAIDITERKELEWDLKEKQDQLNEAQSIVKLGYYSYNFLTCKGTGSTLFHQISGIDEDINVEQNIWLELVHPDFREKFSQLMKATIAREFSTFEMEYKIVHLKTKEEKWVRGLGKLKYNEKNEPLEIFGTIQDITLQKEDREKLAQSNEKLDNIISHSSSLFYTHTPDGLLTFLSPQSKELLDCEPEIAMLNWQEFVTDNPANKPGVKLTAEAIKTGKKQSQYTLELETKKGRLIWVLVDESPVVKDGKTVAIVGSLTDITKRKKLEERIRESEEKFRLVIESSPVGIALHDPQGNILYCNKRFTDLLGYELEEIPTADIWYQKAYPDKDYMEQVREKWRQHIDEYLAGGAFSSFEADVTCKDGTVKNIEFGFGAIEGLYFTTFVDVTERRTILKEVERNKALLNENEKLSKTGAWEYDVSKRETYWTDGINRIYDIDSKTLEDKLKDSLECYSKEDREKVSNAFEACIEKGEKYDLVFPFTSFQGNQKWIRTITRPIIENGKVTKAIGSLMDLTEQVKNESQLKELNATKDKLFSIVSHDLRNPIGAIINLAEVALEKIDESTIDELKKYLSVINSSGQRSIDLLNNLLEWSAINTGRISIYTKDLKLYACIENINELFKSQIHNKSISFNNLIPKDFIIQADEKLLNTVLRNLISNAIKFTPENGLIVLNVIQTKTENIISVSDTGVGIEKKDIDKLFDSNTFFSKHGTNNERGSGLGLMLCSEFVKMHNGHIKVKSELGKGTTFEIFLPIID